MPNISTTYVTFKRKFTIKYFGFIVFEGRDVKLNLRMCDIITKKIHITVTKEIVLLWHGYSNTIYGPNFVTYLVVLHG